MKHPLLSLALLAEVALVGCASVPSVRRHPLPELADYVAALDQFGCSRRYPRAHACAPESQPGQLGCDWLEASQSLGGFTPTETLLACELVDYQRALPEGEFVYGPIGVFLPTYTRYVVATPAGLVLLKTAHDLRARYAPVESAAEAIGFATALTGLSIFSEFKALPHIRYYVRSLDETHVLSVPDGYMVKSLTYKDVFGCGPHAVYLVDVLVFRDGTVQRGQPQRIFEDPKEDDLCVD